MFLRTFGDSILSALRELWTNKLRAALSLSGISIGIFCVVAVLAAIDSMERNLKQSIEKFGADVIYVNKWPWLFSDNYPWWKYINRPYTNYVELQQLRSRLQLARQTAISVWDDGKKASYGGNEIDGIALNGCSLEYAGIMHFEFASGRFFSQEEADAAMPVAILGYEVVNKLFPSGMDAVGQQIIVSGSRVRIIGTLQKEGESLTHNSNDNLVIVPYHFFTKVVKIDGLEVEPTLLVQAKPGITLDQLSDELRGAMRGIRRQPPRQEDNFALNRISIVTSLITQIFGALDIVAFIIGGFALLVGGFGIANIMFVSVRERTNLIGIKKAIGARNGLILAEFLVEAVILSVIGGAFGLLLVYLIALAASSAAGFELALSTGNIVTGLVISSIIGILAGLWPAFTASRLHPVDAIRFK